MLERIYWAAAFFFLGAAVFLLGQLTVLKPVKCDPCCFDCAANLTELVREAEATKCRLENIADDIRAMQKCDRTVFDDKCCCSRGSAVFAQHCCNGCPCSRNGCKCSKDGVGKCGAYACTCGRKKTSLIPRDAKIVSVVIHNGQARFTWRETDGEHTLTIPEGELERVAVVDEGE